MAINPIAGSTNQGKSIKGPKTEKFVLANRPEENANFDRINDAVLAVIHICNRDCSMVSTTIRRIDAVVRQLKQLQQDILDVNKCVLDDEDEEVIAVTTRHMTA